MTGRTMPLTAPRPANPVLRRLGDLATLSEAEQQAVAQLAVSRERRRAGEELLREGDPAGRPVFLLSGWAMIARLLTDGRRQIFRFVLPGDGLGIYPSLTSPAPYSVIAATSLETVDAEPVLGMLRAEQAPGVLRALAAASRIENARLLDHLVRLGRQTAYERVAHFLLELQERLAVVGLGDERRFSLPLTQEMLADTLGLSIVHVNRTLQQLRRDGLIEWRAGMATLLDREQLARIADYRGPVAPIAPRKP